MQNISQQSERFQLKWFNALAIKIWMKYYDFCLKQNDDKLQSYFSREFCRIFEKSFV